MMRGQLIRLALLGSGGAAAFAVGAVAVRENTTPGAEVAAPSAPPSTRDTTWTVGRRQPNGLRIVPTGRADASAVLAPAQFADSATRHACWVATQIPAVLNQRYQAHAAVPLPSGMGV